MILRFKYDSRLDAAQKKKKKKIAGITDKREDHRLFSFSPSP